MDSSFYTVYSTCALNRHGGEVIEVECGAECPFKIHTDTLLNIFVIVSEKNVGNSIFVNIFSYSHVMLHVTIHPWVSSTTRYQYWPKTSFIFRYLVLMKDADTIRRY